MEVYSEISLAKSLAKVNTNIKQRIKAGVTVISAKQRNRQAVLRFRSWLMHSFSFDGIE